jgi:hypothetical protein
LGFDAKRLCKPIFVLREASVNTRSSFLAGDKARLRRCVSLTLVSFLAACGGGGGAGGALPTLPAGEYHAVTFKGFHGPPDNVRTNVGPLLSDGVSTLTDAGSIENENGVISADPGGPVIPYSISPDGVISISDSLGEHFRGGLTAGGKTFALAAVLPFFPSEAGLTLALKKDSGLSDATLTGDYHTCYFGTAGGGHVGVVGTAAFDGAGGVGLGTTLTNTDGVITGPSFGVGAYAVTTDGAFTLGPAFRGGVSSSGDHAIAGGGVTPGSLQLTWVFVRQATAADLGSLTGTYTIVGVGYDVAEGKYSDMAGSVRVDGDGRCMVTVTINREGVLSTLFWASAYTVAPDGTLELTLTGTGNTFRGAISADGSFGMLGGGVVPGSDPALFVLFRRE